MANVGSGDETILELFSEYCSTSHVRSPQHTWQGPLSAPKLDDALRARFVEQVLPHSSADYCVQEKLDGQMLMFTGKTAFTKSGNVYESIPIWFQQQALPPGLPLIGEIFRGPGWGNESLRGIASHAADTQESHEVWAHKWEAAKFVVFDIPGLTNTPYIRRHEVLSVFVRKWNQKLLKDQNLILPPSSLPLQCIRTYPATRWPDLLREVMLQPIVRQLPPWGDGTGVCMVAQNSISLDEQDSNMSRAFSPAGEGLVFHHHHRGWVGRHSTAHKKELPAGVKLKPRLLMPARVISRSVQMWGEHSAGSNRMVPGYKIRVSYYHPGRRELAETHAMVVPLVGVTANTVADLYTYGSLVFLTTFGVTYSTGNLRAHPIANHSLLSWQMHGLTQSLANGIQGIDGGGTLLQLLGWERNRETGALTPMPTNTTSDVRMSLLASLCKLATALPLHPSAPMPFQRLLCTTHTDAHIRRRYLPTINAGTRPAPRAVMLVPDSLVPRDISGSAVDNVVNGSTLAHFVRIMTATVNYVDITNDGVTTLLRPLHTVAHGDVLARGLVTQWCGLCAVSKQNDTHPSIGGLIYLCQCIVLTCCARVWRDVEGCIGRVWDDTQCKMRDTAYQKTFVQTIRDSLLKVVTHWNAYLTKISTIESMGFNVNVGDRAKKYPLDIIAGAVPHKPRGWGSGTEWVLSDKTSEAFWQTLPRGITDQPFAFVEKIEGTLVNMVDSLLPAQPRPAPNQRPKRARDIIADLQALDRAAG